MAFGRSGQCFSDGTCAVPPNTDVVYDVTVVDIFDEVLIEDIVEGDGEVAEPEDVLFVEYDDIYSMVHCNTTTTAS